MVKRYRRLVAAYVAAVFALYIATFPTISMASDSYITVASTTSTANSGLFDHILPIFKDVSGIEVRVVAVGTGQAIRLARNGDADVLFVHHKPSEEAFVADGLGEVRQDVMYNDFVVIGPREDPAGLASADTISDVMTALTSAKVPFVSRGDDSGTHKREQALWEAVGGIPDAGSWYREIGAGMGATLNVAQAMGAYTISDRATWLAFKNKDGMTILFEGDENLFNQYGIIAVSQDVFPHIKKEPARQFIDWVISDAGQHAIAGFKLNGTQLFFPNGVSR